MARPPAAVLAFLAVGLLAASQSGNIIRLGDAHPVAIAAWRLVLASALLAPLAGRRFGQLAALGRTDRWLLLAAGSALALHFFAWIAAVQHTTVARAATVFAANPVLTAVAAHLFFREGFSLRLGLSIGLGFAGVAAIALDELDPGQGSLAGDGLALLCSALFTAYFLLGKRLRRRLDNRVYAPALYAVAALVALATLLGLGLPLVDYDGRTWLCFGLMALVPTMIGHTSFNHAVRYIPAGRISAATLSEPALAGLVAWFAWDEAVGPWTLVGYGLIAASVVVLVSDRPGNPSRPAPPAPSRS
jgi:drug/metabolite transporter (DMT)-like permease